MSLITMNAIRNSEHSPIPVENNLGIPSGSKYLSPEQNELWIKLLKMRYKEDPSGAIVLVPLDKELEAQLNDLSAKALNHPDFLSSNTETSHT